jgi:hypothetical protein
MRDEKTSQVGNVSLRLRALLVLLALSLAGAVAVVVTHQGRPTGDSEARAEHAAMDKRLAQCRTDMRYAFQWCRQHCESDAGGERVCPAIGCTADYERALRSCRRLAIGRERDEHMTHEWERIHQQGPLE